jgi:hypothetical protein
MDEIRHVKITLSSRSPDVTTLRFLFLQCHHMSLIDFVVSPPSCGRSVTNLWGWDAHETRLRCPGEWMVIQDYELPKRGLNLSSNKLPRQWSPWESSPLRKYPHDSTGNRTQNLMLSSQKLWPLDHETGPPQICCSGNQSSSWYNTRNGRHDMNSFGAQITVLLPCGKSLEQTQSETSQLCTIMAMHRQCWSVRMLSAVMTWAGLQWYRCNDLSWVTMISL